MVANVRIPDSNGFSLAARIHEIDPEKTVLLFGDKIERANEHKQHLNGVDSARLRLRTMPTPQSPDELLDEVADLLAAEQLPAAVGA